MSTHCAVIDMGKQSNGAPTEEGRVQLTTVKAYPEDRLTISRIAAMSNVGNHEVLARPDVRNLLKHILVELLQKEAERLKGPKKSG